MKIAIFSGEIPSATFIEHLIEGVVSHHKVLLFGVIVTPKTYTNNNIKIYKTPHSHVLNLCYTLWRLLLLGITHPSDIFKLFKEVKQYKKYYDKWIWFSKFLPMVLYKPDILHLQWARDLEFYYFLKEDFNIKLMVSLRGAHINYTPIVEPRMAAIYKNTFPKVDAFHAVSEAVGIEAQKYAAPSSKINLIHSPIPSSFFDEFTIYTKSIEKTIKLISVGRFHWKKGFKYVLDALFLLKEKGYSIEYTIVGPKEMTEAISFQIHQLNLNDQVKLIGSIGQRKLIKEIKLQDILILSSVEEGIANVVLEAMAVGLPVISTDCGGMPEVVKHKETGWLVPIRNPTAIVDAIIELSKTPEKELQRITQNAHDFVKAEFHAEDNISQFVDLYEEVVLDT